MSSRRRNFLSASVCLFGGIVGLVLGLSTDGGRNIVGEITLPASAILFITCILFIILGFRS